MKSVEKTCPIPKECEKCVVKTDKTPDSVIIKAVGVNNPMFLHGKLIKEALPSKELIEENTVNDEVEDKEIKYVYFLEFERQHLLVNNSKGAPVYINKIQLTPPVNDELYDVEDFVEKEVEIYGYQVPVLTGDAVFQMLSVKSN